MRGQTGSVPAAVSQLYMSEPMTLKRGAELELEIDSLAYGGMGLARRDNFVIFVKNSQIKPISSRTIYFYIIIL